MEEKKKNSIGRPNIPENQKAKTKSFRLYDWEVEKVKEFIKQLRQTSKTVLRLFLIVCFICNLSLPAYADSIRMHAPTRDKYNWDLSELSYDVSYYNGEHTVDVCAKTLGLTLPDGSYQDNSKNHIRNWVGWKYYVSHYGWLECFNMYEDTLISTLYYDKEEQAFLEYKPKGLKRKGELIAKYRRINDDEFERLDGQGNVVSTFTRKNHIQHYWFEYDTNGNLITKHLTDCLPFQPTIYKHWVLGNDD